MRLIERLRADRFEYSGDLDMEAADYIDELEKQRDELLAALEVAKPHVEFANRMVVPCASMDLRQINAAIASVKGGTA